MKLFSVSAVGVEPCDDAGATGTAGTNGEKCSVSAYPRSQDNNIGRW